jgi:hypothetical protein
MPRPGCVPGLGTRPEAAPEKTFEKDATVLGPAVSHSSEEAIKAINGLFS